MLDKWIKNLHFCYISNYIFYIKIVYVRIYFYIALRFNSLNPKAKLIYMYSLTIKY
jgi:hypothetical protein